MMNKIFVFGGIALSAILIVENMVTWMTAYVFIDDGSKAWFLSVVSIVIWVFIWYGLRGMFEKDSSGEDENYDF
jgi:hypothetical protein